MPQIRYLHKTREGIPSIYPKKSGDILQNMNFSRYYRNRGKLIYGFDPNIIYNYYNGKPTLGWKGHGIFFDDACHYFTATNNIVYESKKQGADAGIFMKSIGTVVRNNVFDVTNTHQGAANISPYQEPCRDQIFMNNIVYADPVGGIGEDGASVEHGSTDRRMYTCDSTASTDPMFVDAKNETMHCQKIRLHLPWDSIILI